MMPSGWDSLPLGEVVNYKKGFAFKSENFKDSGRRIIRISDTTASSIKNDSPVFVNEDSSLKDFELSPNDIILSTVGSRPPLYDSMVGKAIKVPSRVNGAYLNQNLVKLIPDEKVDRDFLFLKLKEPRFISYISTLVRGNANQVSITLDELFNYQLLLPSKNEQEKIAKILSTWDEAIEKLGPLVEQKKSYYTGLSQKLKSVAEENGEVITFDDLFDIRIGGTPSRSKPEYWCDDHNQSGHSWAAISDLKQKYLEKTSEKISDLGVEKSNVKLIPSGTVIMSFKLSIGRKAILKKDCYTNEAIAAFVIKKSGQLSNEYLYHALNWVRLDAEIDEAIKGKTLNKDKLKRLILTVPPLEVQQSITSALEAADQQISLTEKILELVKLQKQGLMQQLLTGKKRVKV